MVAVRVGPTTVARLQKYTGKLPVVRHLPFGRLLPWSDAPGDDAAPLAGAEQLPSDGSDHIRRASFGTAPPSGLPDNRLAVLAKIKADKEAAAAAMAAAAAAPAAGAP